MEILKQSVEELENLCKENPEDYIIHTQLGYVLREMGQIERAKEHYEKALQLNNEYADAYNNMGYLLLHDLNNIDIAEKYFLKAIEYEKDFANPYRHLGDLYYLFKSNYNKAKQYYQLALNIKPDYKEVKINLEQIKNMNYKSEEIIQLTPCSKDIMLPLIKEKKRDEDEIKEPDINHHHHNNNDEEDENLDGFNIMDDYDDNFNLDEEEVDEEEDDQNNQDNHHLNEENKIDDVSNDNKDTTCSSSTVSITPIEFEDRPSYKNVDSMNIFEKQQENDAMMAAIKNHANINGNNGNYEHTHIPIPIDPNMDINNFQIPNLNNYGSNTSVKSHSLYQLNSNYMSEDNNNNNNTIDNHDPNLELEDCGSERLKLLFRTVNNNSLFAWLEQQEQNKAQTIPLDNKVNSNTMFQN